MNMWTRNPNTPVFANTSNTDNSPINSLSSAEDNEVSRESRYDTSHHIDTDSQADKIICDSGIQADQPRLCQDKQAHELVLRKTDGSLVKRLLAFADAFHLDTKT